MKEALTEEVRQKNHRKWVAHLQSVFLLNEEKNFCGTVQESRCKVLITWQEMQGNVVNNKTKTRLILGRGRNASVVRLKRFLKAFPHTGLDLDDVAYVDLRYDVGFAVGKVENSGDNKNGAVPKKQ